MELISVNHGGGSQTPSHLHFMQACQLLMIFSLEASLFTQFACKITEEEAGEEIRSSTNY